MAPPPLAGVDVTLAINTTLPADVAAVDSLRAALGTIFTEVAVTATGAPNAEEAEVEVEVGLS